MILILTRQVCILKYNFSISTKFHFVWNGILICAIQLMSAIKTRYFSIQTTLSTISGIRSTSFHMTYHTTPTDKLKQRKAFVGHFYPVTLHLQYIGFKVFDQFMNSLGIKPMLLALYALLGWCYTVSEPKAIRVFFIIIPPGKCFIILSWYWFYTMSIAKVCNIPYFI